MLLDSFFALFYLFQTKAFLIFFFSLSPGILVASEIVFFKGLTVIC